MVLDGQKIKVVKITAYMNLVLILMISGKRISHLQKKVKAFIELYGDPDVIQVRKTFNNKVKAQEWEKRVLLKLNTKSSNKWLNDGCYMSGVDKHSEESKKKMSESSKGKFTKEHCNAISKGRRGMTFSQTHIDNIRIASTGVKQSEETKLKRAKTISQLKWWNNGKINKRSQHCPGDDFTEGRIKGFSWKKKAL